MKDSNFRNGDAKTAIFGSEVMLTPSPVDKIPDGPTTPEITYADLKRFNPWLRDRKLVTGGKTYKLSIPQEKDMYYKTPNTEVYDSAWVVSEN